MVKEVNHTNGKAYPVKYGFAALAEFCELEKISLAEMNSMGQSMKLQSAIRLVFVGLKHGARKVKDKTFNLAEEDVADLMDDDKEFMNNVLKVFSESQALPEDSKKNTAETPNQ